VLLVLVQVLIFNRLNFFGFINPMVYIMFLYWYPIKENRAAFIGVCFLLGLTIDFFSDTMALNAASTVTIAYLRPTIMRFVFGVNYEFQSFKLGNATKVQQITFLALLIVIHHLVFFTLEIFNLANILLILKKVIFIGPATLVLCLLFGSLFSVRKE
jgi:rod shape-determining protein MreD